MPSGAEVARLTLTPTWTLTPAPSPRATLTRSPTDTHTPTVTLTFTRMPLAPTRRPPTRTPTLTPAPHCPPGQFWDPLLTRCKGEPEPAIPRLRVNEHRVDHSMAGPCY